MNLTTNEFNLIENRCIGKCRAIASQYDSLADLVVEGQSDLAKYQLVVRSIRQCAEQQLAARVNTYIEECVRFRKFPDAAVLAKFAHVSRLGVLSGLEVLTRFLQDPLGEAISPALAAKLEKSLGDEFEFKIVPNGLQPSKDFYLEGKVEMEKRENDSKNVDPSIGDASRLERLLTPADRLWLETKYEHQRKGEPVSDRVIEIELHDKLPRGFVRPSIPGALFRGERVTILGIALVDPENQMVKDTDKVIGTIRSILAEEPDAQKISAKEISDRNGLNVRIVEQILHDMGNFSGLFHNSGMSAGATGWSAINIDEERTFRDYRKYENLQQVLEDLIPEEPEPPQTKNEDRLNAAVGHTIHVGDVVHGPQIKNEGNIGTVQTFRHVSAVTEPLDKMSNGWSTEAKLAFWAIIVAIILAIVGYAIAVSTPETRAFVCGRTGLLCSKSSDPPAEP